MNRKIMLAVALAFCLILSAFPITASAEQANLFEMILKFIFPQPSEGEHIKILNPVSRPTLWGMWEIEFETSGEGDLEIEAYSGTYFGKEIELLGLYCGDENVAAKIYFSNKTGKDTWFEGVDNGKMVIEDWFCDEQAKLKLLILETGVHNLRFKFDGQTVYAENAADCTGTGVSPCYKCDVSAMNATVYAPNSDISGPHAMTYSSTSGTCQYIQGDTDFATGDNWISTSNVTFGVTYGGRTTVRIGGPAWQNMLSVRSFTIAQSIKVDFYTGPTAGTQHIMAFDNGDSTYRFCVQYAATTNQFQMQTRILAGGWGSWQFPLTVTKNAWYSVELIWYANGTAAAWLYPSGGSRNTTNHYVNSTFPSGGTYYLISWNNEQYSYLSRFRTSEAPNETWTYNLGYTFCPAEGNYYADRCAMSEGDTSESECIVTNNGFEYNEAWPGITRTTETSYSGSYSGKIVKETAGESVVLHGDMTLHDNSAQYRYGGCVYSNGPTADIFFFSWNATESKYDGTYNYVTTSTTGQWVCLQGVTTNVVSDDVFFDVRVDNNGGSPGAGSVWFDDIFVAKYVYNVNYDTNENWCDCSEGATGCSGGSCWGPTRGFSFDTGTNADCCEDDSDEYYNYRDEHFSGAELPFDDDTTDDACCNTSAVCVYSGECYANATAHDLNADNRADARCYNGANGRWINTDYHTSYCTGAGAGYEWNVSVGDATGDNYAGTWGSSASGYCRYQYDFYGGSFVASIHCCCGDDSGENLNTENTYSRAIAFDNDQQACCDVASDCVGGTSCYTAQSSGTTNCGLNVGANDNCSHCYNNAGSGQWLDCDQADFMDYWCGNVCGPKKGVISPRDSGNNPNASWNAVYAGEVGVGEYPDTSTLECCGDDSGENYINVSYAASIENVPDTNLTHACCDTSTDCVNGSICYSLSGTADVDTNGDNDVCSSSNTWIDCTDTTHCDPAGEYAEGEGSQACYGGTDCSEACTSNDCIYTRNNGFSDCDLETACTSGNCMQDTEYAGTADAGACDNADGCICNTCDTYDLCIPSDGCPFDNDWDEAAADCYNPADQGGNCFASSGDTNKDVDNDGDNDWCSSGTWYDCQTDAQCLKGATQYECVDNDCDESIIDGGHNTTCDSSNPCLFLENNTGFVARFDQFGNVDVKGSYSYDQGSLTPPDNSFIIHNSGGTPVLYIDSYGNLATTGRFISQANPNPTGGDDFIIKDSGGNVQGYIDAATGNMYFKNDFHYNSDF